MSPSTRRAVVSLMILLICSCTSSGLMRDSREELYKCKSNAGQQLIKLPGWENAWQVAPNCKVAEPIQVSIAMKIFYMHWLDVFGDPLREVKNNLHTVMILWGDKIKTTAGYRMDGSYNRNIRAIGIAHTKGTIWIKKDANDKICKSSLIHELVHISIWVLKGTDGDPDHLGDKYAGWTVDHSALIETVKDELCRLGV